MESSLNVIKEIKVTDSFLTLDEEAKGCQEESFNECTTTKYRDKMINKCQCLPFQLRLSEEVSNIWLLLSKERLNISDSTMYCGTSEMCFKH